MLKTYTSLVEWKCLYLLVSFDLQPVTSVSVSFQIDGRVSQWLGNFKFSIGLQGISSDSSWLPPAISTSLAPLQNRGQRSVLHIQLGQEAAPGYSGGKCCWALLAAESVAGNSICAKNKKNITGIVRREVCHSLCACVCWVIEVQPTPIYATHTKHTCTGFIICQHFLEIPPPPCLRVCMCVCLCQPKVFLSLSPGHMCVIFRIALLYFYCDYHLSK